MKRKKIIGNVLLVIGAIMFNITLFLKKDAYSEFYEFELIMGGAILIFVGCYLLYQVKKAQRKEKDQGES